MPYILCRTSDGRILSASRWDVPVVDVATQVVVTLPEMPDNPNVMRWDGSKGLRAETPQEQNTRLDTRAGNIFDGDVLTMAVVRWVAQKLNVPAATAKQEILAIYRNLS